MVETILVTLKNTGKAPRGVHNAKRQAVIVPPNGEKPNVEITKTLFNIMQRGDGDLRAIPQQRVAPPPKKAPPTPPQRGIGSSIAAPKPKDPNKDIPEDWRKMEWNALRRLAIDLSGGPIRNREDAEKAILEAGGK